MRRRKNTERPVSGAIGGHLLRGEEDLSDTPEMVKVAHEPELKKALPMRRGKRPRVRSSVLKRCSIGKRPQTKPCEAINGIVAEGEETIEDFGESAAIDTGPVAAGQANRTI